MIQTSGDCVEEAINLSGDSSCKIATDAAKDEQKLSSGLKLFLRFEKFDKHKMNISFHFPRCFGLV